MAAGFEVTKADLDRRMGSAVITLRDSFVQIQRIAEFLGRMTDEDLLEMGYTADEIALVKSSFGDLMVLKSVAEGAQAQPSATNFFAWGSRLTGLE